MSEGRRRRRFSLAIVGIGALMLVAFWLAHRPEAVRTPRPDTLPPAADVLAVPTIIRAEPAGAAFTPAASTRPVGPSSSVALVAVTVRRPDGGTVAGALVTVDPHPPALTGSDPTPQSLARDDPRSRDAVSVPTGFDGVAVIPLTSSGLGAVSASLAGWLPEVVSDVVWNLGGVTNVNVDLLPAGSIRVEVVDAGGAPVDAVDVACEHVSTEYLDADNPRRAANDRRARSDAQGVAIIADVASGYYRLSGRVAGRYGAEIFASLGHPGDHVNARIVMDVADPLLVSFVDATTGRPVSGIRLACEFPGFARSQLMREHLSQADGVVRLWRPPGRTAVLLFTSADFDTPPRREVPPDESAITVEVTPRPAIACVVMSETGEQVFDVDIDYRDLSSAWTERQAAADGVFHVKPRGPRSIRVRFHHPTLGTSGWRKLRVGDADRGPVSIMLSRPATVRGQVRGSDGEPCRAHVQLVLPMSIPAQTFGAGGIFIDGATTTDAEGRFEIALSGPATYMLRVLGTPFAFDDVYVFADGETPRPEPRAPGTARIVRAPADKGIDLGVITGQNPGAVSVSVLRSGAPWAFARVWLSPTNQSPHVPMPSSARADANGVARFARVISGTYRVVAKEPSIEWQPPLSFGLASDSAVDLVTVDAGALTSITVAR